MTGSTTDRRTALKLIGGGLAAAPLIAKAEPTAWFDCGVASGDPTHDSVMIWTRLDVGETKAPQKVRWQMARDKNMRRISAQWHFVSTVHDKAYEKIKGPRFHVAQRNKQKDGSLLRRVG